MRLVDVLVGHGSGGRIGWWDAVASGNKEEAQMRFRVNWQGNAGGGTNVAEFTFTAAAGSVWSGPGGGRGASTMTISKSEN